LDIACAVFEETDFFLFLGLSYATPIFVNHVFINHARLVEQKAAYHQADTFSIPDLFKL
jgi:hypothetical protein